MMKKEGIYEIIGLLVITLISYVLYGLILYYFLSINLILELIKFGNWYILQFQIPIREYRFPIITYIDIIIVIIIIVIFSIGCYFDNYYKKKGDD